jgi:aminoglycoside phosphotransferase (APT) family kinase protein
MEPVEVLRTRFPELDLREVRTIEDGWDSLVLEVAGVYVFRFPRRPEVEEWVEREIRLLPELADSLLPVAVPRFELVARNGLLCVGYRKLVGAPAAADLDERAGEDLGRFLSTLHRFPVERARSLDVPYFEPDAWRERFTNFCGDLRQRVVPLLSRDERERAEVLFGGVAGLDFEPVLVHGDLGPEHVLCSEGRIVGVIDWSDARVGDAALDLAWCLNGASDAVAGLLTETYGVDSRVLERSRFYHRLGPWHEVVYGLDSGLPQFVRSGIEGIRRRLPG